MTTPSGPDVARPRLPRAGRVPGWVHLPAWIGAAFLVLPLVGVLVRAPWGQLPTLLGGPLVREALRLSLICASAATVLAALVGIPLAVVLARGSRWWVGPVRAAVTLPLVLPPVVGGVALLSVLGRRGLVGEHLDAWFGWRIPFSTLAVVLAEAFVALPFLVLTVEAAVRADDGRLDEAAATLGARPWTVLRRVTLPLVAPSVVSGLVLGWARALGEFGATITFAGNAPGRTQTVPLAVYLLMETDPAAALAVSVVLLGVSMAVLLALRARWPSVRFAPSRGPGVSR